jgi:hypothetical protein
MSASAATNLLSACPPTHSISCICSGIPALPPSPCCVPYPRIRYLALVRREASTRPPSSSGRRWGRPLASWRTWLPTPSGCTCRSPRPMPSSVSACANLGEKPAVSRAAAAAAVPCPQLSAGQTELCSALLGPRGLQSSPAVQGSWVPAALHPCIPCFAPGRLRLRLPCGCVFTGRQQLVQRPAAGRRCSLPPGVAALTRVHPPSLWRCRCGCHAGLQLPGAADLGAAAV